MFGGYEVTQYLTPDLEKEMHSVDEEEDVPPRLVPHKYNLTRKCNPWMLSDDLAMVAECSELEGPKPLHIIRDKDKDDFDTNHFAVKIMAVDTQAVKSNSFHLNEDMNVLLIEDTCGTYAYVHHFTLYDTEARGFVRPFCMAYVSSDREKMCDLYETMNKEFSMVSRIFHSYNIKVFKSDLENKIDDLKHTRTCFLKNIQNEDTNKDIPDIFKGVTLCSIENLLQEAVAVYNVAQSDCGHHCDYFSRSGSFSYGDNISTHSQVIKREPYILDVRHGRRFDFSLRTLEELCRGGADEGMFTLENIYKHFNRSSLTLHIEELEKTFNTPSQSVVTFGKILTGNLHYYKDGLNVHGIKSPYNSQGSSISSGTVDSFKSADDQCTGVLLHTDNKVHGTSTHISSKKCHPIDNNQLTESLDVGWVETSDLYDSTLSQLFSEYSGCVECARAAEMNRPFEQSIKTSITHIKDLTWTSPGYHLLNYANTLPFLVDVIYSLMRGLSVVVMATHNHDNDVAPLLKALSLFVPTNNSAHHHIIVDPQRLPQILAKSKLVGCIRPEKDKKEILDGLKKEEVVTVDLDRKSCSAPSYKTGLLTSKLMSKRKQFKEERTFLSHIHCVLLEYVMKAFVHIHFTRKNHLKPNVKSPFSDLSLSDRNIVEGLVKVVLSNDT